MMPFGTAPTRAVLPNDTDLIVNRHRSRPKNAKCIAKGLNLCRLLHLRPLWAGVPIHFLLHPMSFEIKSLRPCAAAH